MGYGTYTYPKKLSSIKELYLGYHKPGSTRQRGRRSSPAIPAAQIEMWLHEVFKFQQANFTLGWVRPGHDFPMRLPFGQCGYKAGEPALNQLFLQRCLCTLAVTFPLCLVPCDCSTTWPLCCYYLSISFLFLFSFLLIDDSKWLEGKGICLCCLSHQEDSVRFSVLTGGRSPPSHSILP